MKAKTLSFILANLIVLAMVTSGIGLLFTVAYKTIHIDVLNSQNEIVSMEFPLEPQSVICLSYDSVHILDKLGMGSRIIGMTKDSDTPRRLQRYSNNPQIADLGTLLEVNIDRIKELQPDVIFIDNDIVALFDELSQIAPVLTVAANNPESFLQGFKEIALKHATIMNKEEKMPELLASIEKSLSELQQEHTGKTAIQAIFMRGELRIPNVTDHDHKADHMLITDLGFVDVGKDYDSSTVENAYDYILQYDPEYILVLDKGAGHPNSYISAKDVVLKNQAIMQTKAFQTGKIIFLTPENIWDIKNGGSTSTGNALINS